MKFQTIRKVKGMLVTGLAVASATVFQAGGCTMNVDDVSKLVGGVLSQIPADSLSSLSSSVAPTSSGTGTCTCGSGGGYGFGSGYGYGYGGGF